MQKVYCFTEDNEDDIPLIEFETSCIPRVGETLLFNEVRYNIIDVDHRIKIDCGLSKHEIVIILGRYCI